ncbi:hypothetical protein [Paraburkholderia sp. SIMBA_054]|jgi:hypothetical protein|uniref:hypothetical protein n=1 Tax=Paraburkholderia sp. SIMBA_054 TaxID=3085795 RepID=UPI00397AF16D
MRYMIRRWLSVLTIAFTAICFNTANATTVMGVRSCGQWTARNASALDRAAAEAWLLGYLGGLATGSRVDVLRDTDYDSLMAWMDNYCKAHPIERVTSGAAQLYLELQGRVPK